MKIKALTELENYNCIVEGNLEDEVKDCYTGDLLSDVMGNAPTDSVLVTIQAHKNTVAVASLVGIKVVILCNGRECPEDMKAAAKEENVTLIGTIENQFSASWKVAKLLNIK